MKRIKTIIAVTCALAVFACTAPAGEGEKTCCEKAVAEGKECAHKCCADAKKDGKTCEKCNPKKEGESKTQ